MIVDEVMAGLGRTGEWFAVDHWDVVPDMIVMAKGLTSAYLPLGLFFSYSFFLPFSFFLSFFLSFFYFLTLIKTNKTIKIGCVAVNEKISNYFDDKFLPGGLTYQAHPMCLAAAVACLEVMEEVSLFTFFLFLFFLCSYPFFPQGKNC